MKNWLIGAIVILLVSAAIYSFIYFIVLPKSAEILLPTKWKNIPAGQKREAYITYLGKATKDSNMLGDGGDMWLVTKEHYNYYLNIYYATDSMDTIAKMVNIRYRFHNLLFDKAENITTDSLP